MFTSAEARKARSSLKLSQSQVAAETGINRTYISLFESGKYALNDEALSKLHEFYARNGHSFDGKPMPNQRQSEPAGTGTINAQQQNMLTGQNSSKAAKNPANLIDTRTKSAIAALHDLQTIVVETGLDSKRTAGAVTAAAVALQPLDFPELLALAKLFSVSVAGLPSGDEFTALARDDKERWERRAAGLLVCAALYGEAWEKASCLELESFAELLQRTATDPWDVRERGILEILFGQAEDFCARYRCDLAPYLVKAAEQRRAPSLNLTGR